MKDYRKLIKAILNKRGYDELIRILKHNHIDEDLHAAWFSEKLRELETAQQ